MRTAVRTMTAGVVAEPGRARLERVPTPEPGPEDVLVRIEGCGVCGSNLPLWEGRQWFRYPVEAGAPGHEGWGVVEVTGESVDELAPGDRVALLSYHAFAEYDVAPAAHCVRLPPALEDEPAPLEALGCAVNVFRRARVQPGDRVAVVGVGFLGSLVAQLCCRAGAEVVCVRRHSRAEGWFERVIEAAGTQDALDTASRLVADRGLLVIAGFHQDGPRTIDLQSWNWRGLEIVNAHERDPAVYVAGMREAAELVVAGELDPSPLYTHEYPLARLGEALDAALRRPPGFLKAIVRP